MNESLASSSIKSAKEDYQAFVREEHNKLKEATGNHNRQLQILDEWRAKAETTFTAGTAAYRSAMAQIQEASLQTSKQTVDQLIHSVHDQLSIASNAIREFELDTQAKMKLKKITPEVGFNANIAEIEAEAQKVKDKINQVLARPDATAAQQTTARALGERTDLRFRADIAGQEEKIAADSARMAAKFAKPFEQAFDKIGNGLENALEMAITRTGQKGQIGRTLARSFGQGIFNIAGDVGGKAIASRLGGTEGQQLGSLLADKLTSFFVTKVADKSVDKSTDAAVYGAAITFPLVDAIAASTAAIVGAIDVSTVLAETKPSILGTTFAKGGIVPSAAKGMLTGGASTVALLHPREMVLPENISSHILGSMSNGPNNNSNSQRDGDVHLTYSPTMSGGQPFQSRSEAENFLRRHSDLMFGMAKQAMRSGWRY